jgi:hypothetical protein
MSSGIEVVDVVDPWIFTTLKNDSVINAAVGGRISNGAALGPQATPYITFDMTSARDITTHNGVIVHVDCIYQVKVIGQGGSYGPIAPTARRMHELLHIGSVTTPKGSLSCLRERTVRYVELDDNVQYRHLGGYYRILVHSTSP